MLNLKSLANGQEQYKPFFNNYLKKDRYQYAYRHTNGELFVCIRATVEECRAARDEWVAKRAGGH